jgi:hypothetical protein
MMHGRDINNVNQDLDAAIYQDIVQHGTNNTNADNTSNNSNNSSINKSGTNSNISGAANSDSDMTYPQRSSTGGNVFEISVNNNTSRQSEESAAFDQSNVTNKSVVDILSISSNSVLDCSCEDPLRVVIGNMSSLLGNSNASLIGMQISDNNVNSMNAERSSNEPNNGISNSIENDIDERNIDIKSNNISNNGVAASAGQVCCYYKHKVYIYIY